jgi:hypothetical protein
LEHDGERYLISYRGESDWVHNLRASMTGRLVRKGQVEQIAVVEVPLEERPALLEVYRDRYAKMPTMGSVLRQMPDPADHADHFIAVHVEEWAGSVATSAPPAVRNMASWVGVA